MTKGFFTITQGAQYIRAAYALALSLKISQKEVKGLTIGIGPDDVVPEEYMHAFDRVVVIPWQDDAANSSWKRENEWKAIHMTPYDHTIKLDADMLFFNDIGHWWDTLSHSEGVFATEVRTYRDQTVTDHSYRQTFVDNKLPNVYTAMFSFKKTEATFELFELAADIFRNWQRYYHEFLEANSRPKAVSADVVFALAAKLLDFEQLNTRPHLDGVPTFVHMKTRLQGFGPAAVDENWTKLIPTYFTPDCNCFIGNYLQKHPLHYYVKEFLTDEIIGFLERKAEV